MVTAAAQCCTKAMRFTALAAVVHATAHRRLFFNSLQVLEWFRAKGLEAYSISCGQSLLYNNIFPKHKASGFVYCLFMHLLRPVPAVQQHLPQAQGKHAPAFDVVFAAAYLGNEWQAAVALQHLIC